MVAVGSEVSVADSDLEASSSAVSDSKLPERSGRAVSGGVVAVRAVVVGSVVNSVGDSSPSEIEQAAMTRINPATAHPLVTPYLIVQSYRLLS